MEDNSPALIVAALALLLCVMISKQIDRLIKDVNSLANGDPETVKLRAKLEGRPDGGS
jgi:hypothetical protein